MIIEAPVVSTSTGALGCTVQDDVVVLGFPEK